ncbi:MAG: hypothetical protein JO304_11745 [Solirubrobacterales bacterium]|nr:hypothetical protein [Solirubrobacterales bacterium]
MGFEEDGENVVLRDAEANIGWRESWPPCPDGKPLRLCHALGFWERNVGELELRVLLGGDDGGVCQTIVEERGEEVYVRVLVHLHDEDNARVRRDREYMDWPVRLWLDRPLGERAVIDLDTDEELPLYTPLYLNNVPQRDHGYRPANRRRRDTDAS